MIREGELIQKKSIQTLDKLYTHLFHHLQAHPKKKIAFFGKTFHTCKVITDFENMLEGKFNPVCIIDNHKHKIENFFKSVPILSFEDAEKRAPEIDMIVVMVDTASIYSILAQITNSTLFDKELISIHRDTNPLTETEFEYLCEASQKFLSRNGIIWYTNEENWFCCYQNLKQVSTLKGGVAEFGVFKGGSAYFIASAIKYLQMESKKTFYLFDTFEGIPVKSSLDQVEENVFSQSGLEPIKTLFSEFKNIKIIAGDISETIKEVEFTSLSLAHIDCDQYEPTKLLCEELYGKMVKGGIMMFQNYSFGITYGERVAVDEFFKDKPENVMFGYDGAGFVVKI
jgi:O-methyltransferase